MRDESGTGEIEADSAMWGAAVLESKAYGLVQGKGNDATEVAGPRPASLDQCEDEDVLALLVPAGKAWAMIPGAGVESLRVNGMALPSGLRLLRDRDEIQAGGSAALYFSEESPAVVVPYPGKDPVVCPRCRTSVKYQDKAVQCRCSLFFHQTEELPCYDHAAECPACRARTSLDDSFSWTPDGV